LTIDDGEYQEILYEPIRLPIGRRRRAFRTRVNLQAAGARDRLARDDTDPLHLQRRNSCSKLAMANVRVLTGRAVEHKLVVALAAFVAGLAGAFFTGYMIGGHSGDHLVEILIAQFIGNGLLAAILATLLLR